MGGAIEEVLFSGALLGVVSATIGIAVGYGINHYGGPALQWNEKWIVGWFAVPLLLRLAIGMMVNG